MAYLLDTNIMVDLTRGSAKAADYLDSLGGACLLSSITALELIAATALEEGLTLATRNRKHFRMIRDLKLEVPEY
jgi:predicted nucleic acid-binding protein